MISPRKWAIFSYLKYGRSNVDNLKYSINPVFRLRYSGSQSWNVTDHEYQASEPAVRLATAMLESLLHLYFLHDLIFARKRSLPGATYVGQWSTFSTTNTLEPIMRERMIRIWDQLARNNQVLSSTDVPPAGLDCTGVVSSGGVPPGADLKGNGQRGPRTEIKIQPGVSQDPVSVTQRFPANDSRVLYAKFDFASTLCHEWPTLLTSHTTPISVSVSSKAQVTKMLNQRTSRPRSSSRLSDVWSSGIAWEQHVLGGALYPAVKAQAGWAEPRYLHQWPTFGVLERTSNATIRGPPPFFVEWLISHQHVELVQQRRFWDLLAHTRDWIMLRIPKKIGCLMVCEEDDVDLLWHLGDRELGDYIVGPHNIVRAQGLEDVVVACGFDQVGQLEERLCDLLIDPLLQGHWQYGREYVTVS